MHTYTHADIVSQQNTHMNRTEHYSHRKEKKSSKQDASYIQEWTQGLFRLTSRTAAVNQLLIYCNKAKVV